MSQPKIYVLHENPLWFGPLRDALDRIDVPYEDWMVVEGVTNLQDIPPEGIFFNRLSASSHRRGHRYAIEYAETMLAWLEYCGRRVVNGRHCLTLEVRKFDQYARMMAHGIQVPKSVAVVGLDHLVQAAEDLGCESFVIKPNRGGKGLGVQRFDSVAALQESVQNGEISENASLDGVFLVQDYIEPKTPDVIRSEFIGGMYHYSVRVDTSEGFELCPADSCGIDQKPQRDKFTVLKNYDHSCLRLYDAFLQNEKIDVAAIESIEAADGTRYAYDVNINTNYNLGAEERAGVEVGAYDRLAQYLKDELEKSHE